MTQTAGRDKENESWTTKSIYNPTAHQYPVEYDYQERVVRVLIGSTSRSVTYTPKGLVKTVIDRCEQYRHRFPIPCQTLELGGYENGSPFWTFTENQMDSYRYTNVSIDAYGIVHYQYQDCDGVNAELFDGSLLQTPFARADWRACLKNAYIETNANGTLMLIKESAITIRMLILDAQGQVVEVADRDGSGWSIRYVDGVKQLIAITNGEPGASYDNGEITTDEQGNISYSIKPGVVTTETIAGDIISRRQKPGGLVDLSAMYTRLASLLPKRK